VYIYSMSYKIIVARYNENIEWLEKDFDNCIVYNKGEKLNIQNEIALENVGRESETYLNYIISNYDSLPDVVVFTQARIDDHYENADINYLINLKKCAFANNKSQSFMTHYQNQIHNDPWNAEWNLTYGKYFLENNYKNNVPLTFKEWFKKHIHHDYPNPIHIYRSGIFAVKKELILNKPKDFYERLILELNHHSDPTEGHFFERSWYYIFH